MINLLYLDNNDKVIEEIEEIDVEKDYDLNKLYFVVDNFKDKIGYLKEKLQIISMDISDIYREYNLNHLEHSANTIYTISKSKFLLMQSGLVEHINLKCKNKIENLFYALKDDKTLEEFLEKRTLVIEKKENTLKILNECRTVLDILNDIQSFKDYDIDLETIK